MSEQTIRMPDLGEGTAEAELVQWRVAPGDTVAEDQVLCDVMTEKATVEIPSSLAGRVVALGCEVGAMLAVGAVLIRIDSDAGAGPTAAPAGAADPPASRPVAAPVAALAAAPVSAPVSALVSATVPAIAPATPPPGRANAKAPSAPPAPESAPHASASRAAGPVLAAPAVRSRARALGLDLAQLRGSGPEGRIVHADLDAARPQGAAASSPATEGRRDIKLIGLRRKIAQRMQEAKRRIAHFSYVEEVDVSALQALRAELNAQYGAARGELSPLAFIVQAVVRAVADYPEVNARFDDEAGVLSVFDAVHLGVATQTDAGLMVPVLHQAQTLDLWAAAAAINRLAASARSGHATRDELSGSTLTVTSLGKLGGIASTPVINLPEVAIVGVNRIVARPMVHEGVVQVRQMMNLSSSFDHRVIDGAVAAAYIQRVRRLLEQPALLFIR